MCLQKATLIDFLPYQGFIFVKSYAGLKVSTWIEMKVVDKAYPKGCVEQANLFKKKLEGVLCV